MSIAMRITGCETGVNINGINYAGENVIVKGDGTIIVDGENKGMHKSPKLDITVQGDCNSVDLQSGIVTVEGNVLEDVDVQSGHVAVAGSVHGDADVTSGYVVAQSIGGDASVVSGYIKRD